jgi:hypothetical protein
MLKDLRLLPVYDSAEFDLVKELMVPLLRESVSYTRGVGFFTSGWLRIASEGLAAFVENGGKAKFVVSPTLERGDWEAFQTGERGKHDEILRRALELQINDIARGLEQNTLNSPWCK